MIIRFLSYLALCLPVYQLAGQQHLPDSLQQKLSNLPQDSNYINMLNLAATEYLKVNPNITRLITAQALALAPKIKYTRGYARALTVTGNAYWYEGVYEFAQNYYLLAARQYQSIHDSIGLGQTYNNIAEIYKKLEDYDKALSYLLRSQELMRLDSATHPLTLYNIGELYVLLNKTDDAKKYISQSMDLAWRRGNTKVIAYNYWSLGAIQRKEKNYRKALDFYKHAEKIWTQLGELRALIQTYQDMAEIYREQQQYDEAEQYLVKAVQLASHIKVADLQVNNYLRFSRLDSLRGNYNRALYYLSRHNLLKDSVYNLLKAEQIARLQTIYETESRDQENQQLRSEKELKDSQLRAQRVTLAAITFGLVLAGILAWFLHLQRKKISLQKEAIEMQAVALLKLNEELQGLNKNLEARIDERTSQLLIQNQRLAEYTFINAHKLRAPVASILGLLNLLQQATPEEREDILRHLKTCGEQLDAIIRQVSRNLEGAIVPEKS